jgi:N-acetylmuramoyl-L-alanine amidase
MVVISNTKNDPMKKFILDAGHGGTTMEKYVTPGKRGPQGGRGQIFEGMSNRAFVNDLAYQLTLQGRQVQIVSDTVVDTGLSHRAKLAKAIAAAHKDCIFISIHSNAMSQIQFADVTGLEIWTTEGVTISDPVAAKIAKGLQAAYGDIKWRRTKKEEEDKEKNWTVIYEAEKAGIPAVLLEVLFMDGYRDYLNLTDPVWRAGFIMNLTDILCDL